jgi:tetratricopeptide (TPR) repeat protein
LRKLGRLDESIEHLKKAVEQKQDKASAHNNLGLSYFEKEEFQEALAEFTKAIQCEDHPFHLNNRGLAYYHIGSLDEAKKDFDEAIKKNDTDPFFYFNRGNVFLDQKEFDKAH